MEKKLKNLLDFQHYAGNKDIEEMYREAEARYPRELSDEELESVAAAGDLGKPHTTLVPRT